MKKIILSAILMLAFASSSFAQRNAERTKNRMESYQIAYITEKLSLTPEESQRFWPVYNQFKEQAKKIRKDNRNHKDIEAMNDVEAEQYIKTHLEGESKELELKKEFIQKLKGIIPPRKIAMLQGLEKEFKKELLERAKERRQMKDKE
jgi:hypothetical protein